MGIERFDDLIAHIDLQVRLLGHFVNDLLDLARIEEGCFKFVKTNFNIRLLIHEMYRMFNLTAEH